MHVVVVCKILLKEAPIQIINKQPNEAFVEGGIHKSICISLSLNRFILLRVEMDLELGYTFHNIFDPIVVSNEYHRSGHELRSVVLHSVTCSPPVDLVPL